MDGRDLLDEKDAFVLATLKAIMEIMMRRGLPASDFSEAFSDQREAFLATQQPVAAGLSEVLHRYANDPERSGYRQRLRQVNLAEPEGSA